MLFRWLRQRRRRRVLAMPAPGRWRKYLDRYVAHWPMLTGDEQARLLELAQVFIAEKRWEGCAGRKLDERMQVVIAAQACLLLLGLDEHDYFPNVRTILIYPRGYARSRRVRLQGGVVTEQSAQVIGTAHYRGPIVLSWTDTKRGGRDDDDGRNVVYHEFAHKLDMADQLIDGTPPLRSNEQLAQWVRVMTAEYDALREKAARGARTKLINPYGATNVGEFFAVVTETFFEQPSQLLYRHPELYEVLHAYYQQDTAARERAYRLQR